MLGFLSSFSDSFLLVAVIWPFTAAFLTLPILLYQYIRYRRVNRGQVFLFYLFIAYALAVLLAFTLYPLPDNPATFCATHHITPQLNPLAFIGDIREDGLQAVLQLLFNVVLFMPLGMFLRNLFGRKLLFTLIAAFLLSSFIEVAQLTGLFGAFQCSYRLFDVDDLVLNTLGAVVGFGLARWLPNFSEAKKQKGINSNPGLVQRLVLLWADYIVIMMAAILTVVGLRLTGLTVSDSAANWIISGWFIVFEFVVPLIRKGQTLFSHLAGATFDDRQRKGWRRVVYHMLRAGALAGLIYAPSGVKIVVALALWIYWLRHKRMLYSRLAGD